MQIKEQIWESANSIIQRRISYTKKIKNKNGRLNTDGSVKKPNNAS